MEYLHSRLLNGSKCVRHDFRVIEVANGLRGDRISILHFFSGKYHKFQKFLLLLLSSKSAELLHRGFIRWFTSVPIEILKHSCLGKNNLIIFEQQYQNYLHLCKLYSNIVLRSGYILVYIKYVYSMVKSFHTNLSLITPLIQIQVFKKLLSQHVLLYSLF